MTLISSNSSPSYQFRIDKDTTQLVDGPVNASTGNIVVTSSSFKGFDHLGHVSPQSHPPAVKMPAPSLSLYKFPFYPAKDEKRLRKELICPSACDQAVTSCSFNGLGHLRFMSNRIPSEPLYYSLNNEERPTTLKFSGVLDLESRATQINPYFGHGASMSTTAKKFEKIKPTFAILPLPQTPSVYSKEAVACSHATVKFLAEVMRTSNIDLHEYAYFTEKDVTSWIYTVVEGGKQGLKLETDPLFVAPGDKTCKHDKTNTAAQLPDPLHYYKHLFHKNPELAKYLVLQPLIKDVDGSVIPPGEYQSRLHDMHLRPVTVEVTPLVSDAIPSKPGQTGKPKYRLVINWLQLLPKPKPIVPPSTGVPSLPACQPLRQRKREVPSDEIVTGKGIVKMRKLNFVKQGPHVIVRDVSL
ncbi:hypothetical protein CPB83DRAFT_849879 [Crepidotus variabilis]|uniref:Uncharacterized protein n=1 Tax=Crepidotus variabilis TaxID=179855 RepID=A0A9P6EKT0_9AGAR|nr:hypothetical protein CPB83DRAFT_849879 [Crepidotus variabilis]